MNLFVSMRNQCTGSFHTRLPNLFNDAEPRRTKGQ